ncbi:hypothetical protein BT93_L4640 [Corymbia citriodora subsp. variegata]|uniref:Uncharacterized protein n=1 Tax=Corymbia citriodora subsp. variegata TaxID=360336 RepID=A0A8T0CTX4_CORYI|nr:hypothetical protein BT93_L4640 [Corymbia citriodora subsp. variegata]
MERLCAIALDLPLHSRTGGESRTEEAEKDRGDDDRDQAGSCGTEDQEFDFGSRAAGSVSSEWRMCAADELFFQGQILPLRLSVSSDSFRVDARRSVSRSDSMEIGSISTRASSMGSSRSNSIGSSHYSSSSSSRSSSMTNSSRASFNRVNPFHAHPSPKPQIGPSPGKFRTRSQKSSPPSSMWEFLRLGLIRTPDIGLAELKLRKSVVNGGADSQCLISRNSSSSSSDSSINNGGLRGGADIKIKIKSSKNRERFLNGSFLGGCRCSVDAVSSAVFAVKSGGQARASNAEDDAEVVGKIRLMATTEAKRKVSRHRTFEWIKELSHATYPVDL